MVPRIGRFLLAIAVFLTLLSFATSSSQAQSL